MGGYSENNKDYSIQFLQVFLGRPTGTTVVLKIISFDLVENPAQHHTFHILLKAAQILECPTCRDPHAEDKVICTGMHRLPLQPVAWTDEK